MASGSASIVRAYTPTALVAPCCAKDAGVRRAPASSSSASRCLGVGVAPAQRSKTAKRSELMCTRGAVRATATVLLLLLFLLRRQASELRPGDSGVAITFCGYLGVAVPAGGSIARRMLIDPLQADVFVAGSYNEGDCTLSELREDRCLWRRLRGLEPITRRSLVRKPSRLELEAQVRRAPHFGAVKRGVEEAEQQGHLFNSWNTWTPVLASPRGHFLHQLGDYSRVLTLLEAHEGARRRRYSRVIFSRLELAWLAPHLPLRLLDPALLWIPTGKPRMNDRHVVMSRAHADVWYRRWELYMSPELLAVLPLQSIVHDGAESIIENVLVARGIDVGEFPGSMFLSCCSESEACWQKGTCEWRPLFCGRRAAAALNGTFGSGLLSRGRGAHHRGCVGVRGKYRAEVSLAVLHAQMLNCGAGYEARGPSQLPTHSPTATLPLPLAAAQQPRRRHQLDGGSGHWACVANAGDKKGDACFWSEGGVNQSEPNIYQGDLNLVPGGGEAQGSPADFPGWECAWQHSPPHGAGARKVWPYTSWLRPETELAGFCANTKTGDGGDCAKGESGSWSMGPNLRTERDCARKCARKCPRCAPLLLPARAPHAMMAPLRTLNLSSRAAWQV